MLKIENVYVDLASNIANKHVTIVWTQGGGYSTDGRKIWLNQAVKKSEMETGGMISHEAGHIGYGSFRIDVETIARNCVVSETVAHRCANVIEDVRINFTNKKIFPGFYRALRAHEREFLGKNIKEPEKMDLLWKVNYFFQGYGALDLSKSLIKEDWEGIQKINSFIKEELSVEASIISIQKLIKIIKRNMDDISETSTLGHTTNPEGERSTGGKSGEARVVSGEMTASEKVIDKVLELEIKEETLNKKEEKKLEQIKKGLTSGKGQITRKINKLKKKGITNGPKSNKTRKAKVCHIKDVALKNTSWAIEARYLRDRNTKEIAQIKAIFKKLKKQQGWNKATRTGRLNKKVVRTYASKFAYKRCYSKRRLSKPPRFLILVDISGSIFGSAETAVKEALLLLSEAFNDHIDYRVVLFSGKYHSRNIIMKDWNEKLSDDTLDQFGQHPTEVYTLSGVALVEEAKHLKKGDNIVIISDGSPEDENLTYGIEDAIPEFQSVFKRFNLFGFSIDPSGTAAAEYLKKCFKSLEYVEMVKKKEELGFKMIFFLKNLLRILS